MIPTLISSTKYLLSFNSLKVRLNESMASFNENATMFQFLIGAIK